AHKFLGRIWRIQENLKEKADISLLRLLHKTIKKVTEDFNGFKFNTAIASLMELTNAIYQSGADREVFSKLLIMISPVTPHFAEELWNILGNKESIFQANWPEYDVNMLVEENVIIVVQVNGKVRFKLEVPRGTADEPLKESVLADERLKPWIQDKPAKNIIIIPDKLVNIVV
ncbi:MAG: class I tRNA ligase family protein, partial [Candidatus Omnitrophica bacterium]|nr:class I tRNA ligase family protein [Candidatus Omnitrophota bacterium]